VKKITFYASKCINNIAMFHLFIVISDPDTDGSVLVVNASTLRNPRRDDSSCVLEPGDHPAISRKSFIAYYFAEVIKTSTIENKCRNNIFRPEEDISDHLLLRIQ